MAIARRIGIFLLTNLAVMLVLSVLWVVLDRTGVLPKDGALSEWLPLGIFSLVWGFGGAFVSLALSKTMAKWSVGAQVLTAPRNEAERWLMSTVGRLAQQAGVGMPEVAIYDSPEMNAFATGARRDASLVAVSTGLLRTMRRDEIEAVLAHEISHVANGDMVTMALVQGVLNAFVYFFSRALARIVDSALSRGESRRPNAGYYLFVFLFDMLFGVLATIVAMWFSRQREYRADAGAASLVGAGPMISALETLGRGHPGELPGNLKAFGISGADVRGLFRSHPPLASRIAALRQQ